MFFSRISLLLLSSFFLLNCGVLNSDIDDGTVFTKAPPFVNRINPISATAGAEITLFGFGFSSEAAQNILGINNLSIAATSYNLLETTTNGEIESLTFTLPTDFEIGEYTFFVLTQDEVSNANLTLEITN